MYFKYDLKVGLKKIWSFCFIVAVLVIVSCIELKLETSAVIKDELTGADYFLHFFEGMAPFDRNSDEYFKLPILWFLFHMLLFYFTGKYPYLELNNGHGANVLLRGRGRKPWFLSKWGFSMVCVILYYIVVYAAILLFCLAAGVPVRLSIQQMDYEGLFSPLSNVGLWQSIVLLFLPVLSSMAAVSLQLTISLILNPLLGFLVMAVIYLTSAYYFTPVLIGNCSMLARNSLFYEGGIQSGQVIEVSFILMVLSVAAGLFAFEKYDITGRK